MSPKPTRSYAQVIDLPVGPLQQFGQIVMDRLASLKEAHDSNVAANAKVVEALQAQNVTLQNQINLQRTATTSTSTTSGSATGTGSGGSSGGGSGGGGGGRGGVPTGSLGLPNGPVPPTPTPFDYATATFLNSPSGIQSWTVSTSITSLSLGPDGINVNFGKRNGGGRWPDIIPPEVGGPIQFSMGMGLYIGGQWYASAPIQCWNDIINIGGPPGEWALNWFYDPGRWSPMTNHQPVIGETIVLFVAAGNCRGNVSGPDENPIQELSAPLTIVLPADGGTFS